MTPNRSSTRAEEAGERIGERVRRFLGDVVTALDREAINKGSATPPDADDVVVIERGDVILRAPEDQDALTDLSPG